MTANDLLKQSLNTLTLKLDELAGDHSSELQPICQALTDITARGADTSDFRRNLKELAEAVIQVRTQAGSSARFRELPVPPYDLWLPFKAKDSTPADSEDLVEASRILNHKVTEAALKHGCSSDDVEKAQPHEPTLSRGSAGGRECKSDDSQGNDR